jgi:glucan biosynthesis protein
LVDFNSFYISTERFPRFGELWIERCQNDFHRFS